MYHRNNFYASLSGERCCTQRLICPSSALFTRNPSLTAVGRWTSGTGTRLSLSVSASLCLLVTETLLVRLHWFPAIHISSATTDASRRRRRRHANHKQLPALYKTERPQPVTEGAHISASVTIMRDNFIWLWVNLLIVYQTAFSRWRHHATYNPAEHGTSWDNYCLSWTPNVHYRI